MHPTSLEFAVEETSSSYPLYLSSYAVPVHTILIHFLLYIYLLFYLLTCLPICQPHLPRHPFFAHLHIYVYTGLQARNSVPMCASTLLCGIYTPKAACPLPAASAPPKVQLTAAGRLENISRWQRLDGLPHLPQLMSAICRSKTMGATSFKRGQI